jgi:hypothetical protein
MIHGTIARRIYLIKLYNICYGIINLFLPSIVWEQYNLKIITNKIRVITLSTNYSFLCVIKEFFLCLIKLSVFDSMNKYTRTKHNFLKQRFIFCSLLALASFQKGKRKEIYNVLGVVIAYTILHSIEDV